MIFSIRKEYFKECVYNPIEGITNINKTLSSEMNYMKKCICNEYNIDYFHCNKLLLKHYKQKLLNKIYSQINTNFTNKILDKLDEINPENLNCFTKINDFSPNSISILTELNKNIDNINISDNILYFIERYKYIRDDFISRFKDKFSEISIPKMLETTTTTTQKEKEFPCVSNLEIKSYISENINSRFIDDIKFVIDSIDSDETTDTIQMYDVELLKKRLLLTRVNGDNITNISEKVTETLNYLSRVVSFYFCIKSNVDNKNNNCCKKDDCSKQKNSKYFYDICIKNKMKLKYKKYNC